MDAAMRAQIMGSILTKQPAPVTESEQLTEAKPDSKSSDDNIFKFRKVVKYIHTYEQIIKKEDIDFSDADWESFEKWYHANKPKPKTMDLVSAAFEKKALRESDERKKRDAIRKQILEKVKFKL